MPKKESPARCAVFVGPQGTGKTTLVTALAMRATGAAPSLDAAPEAKEFGMTTDPNLLQCEYLGEAWSFIDCPGSVELMQASLDAMEAADIVILVAEPSPDRAAGLAPYFKFLDDRNIPHAVFINRLEDAQARVRDILEALQSYSTRPLVLRQAPMRENDKIVGAIDLVSERAWRYREGAQSELIEIPAGEVDREHEAREMLLDAVADFDDALLEQILEDKTPPSAELFALMGKELAGDLVSPVFLGSAAHGHGLTRLLKFLRHEAPDPAAAAARHGYNKRGANVASVIRTMHVPHAGKISLARVWKGAIKEGDTIDGGRASGLLSMSGEIRKKVDAARTGDLIGLPRFDSLETGDVIADGKIERAKKTRAGAAPVYSLAIRARNERDDVKLSAALAKLLEEDASLSTERRIDTGEFILRGQGDIHLRLSAARLKNRFNVEIESGTPKPCYRESIRGTTDHHSRHKKQSGGHGQFADIKVKIRPLARGDGFRFDETIHGGAVPRQFIPAVEAGVKEGLVRGPLGFPVVDLAVTLYDGQHHSVDSNEMSFKLAGRQAVRDALPACDPVLLEPIYLTIVHTPSEYTNKVHGVISSRRGQILGFDARDGWPGWDSVTAMLPESGIQDLIIELRSLTQGAATFDARFDHYQELYGKDAERIVEEHRRRSEAA